MTVFRTEAFHGEPRETEEMNPTWFPVDRIPYREMHDGDEHWLPYVLRGEAFEARMVFDGAERNVEHTVVAV